MLEAYDAADEVLIVRVLSMDTVEDPTGGRPNSENSILTIGRVERVYKGSSKINDQLVFGQSRFVTCLWSFDKSSMREKAVLIDVGVGDKLQNLNMVVPAMLETVTVEGTVYFSNGRPAQKQTVRFTPTSSNNINDLAQVYTDDKGRFSLKIFKGLTGDVLSETHAWGGMFEDCPAFDAQMRNSSQKIAGFKTPALRIEAQHDIRNLVLRFSLPKCEAK